MNSIRILLATAAALMPLAAGAAEVSPVWYGRGGTVVGPKPEQASPARHAQDRVALSRGVSLNLYHGQRARQGGAVAERVRSPTGG